MKTPAVPVIFLKPGEFHLSMQPEIVVTILGSCVALIMYDTESGICASTHCILPVRSNYDIDGPFDDFKYVDTSFKRMLEIFENRNITQNKIMVKLFGGAEQLTGKPSRRHSVGKQNVFKALDLLNSRKMNVVAMDVGGNEGRKIYMSSNTGEVLLTRLGNSKTKTMRYNEKNKSLNCR